MVNRATRVLHVITGLGVGGAETMLARLAAMAPTEMLDQRIVSLTPGGAVRAGMDPSMVSDLGMARALPSPLAILRLARMIRDFRPDVVQGWMYHADLMATLALFLSGRRRQTALCWGVRCSDMDTSRYSAKLKLIIAACARLSPLTDAIVANSAAGREVHQSLGYQPSRFEIIPNGIDTDCFAPDPSGREAARTALGLASDAQVVAHVARVDPMKDHAGMLKAMERLPDIHCLLIGTGTESLTKAPNIHGLGCRQDVPALLAAADVIVSSSAFGEGFSNALAEGMACGLPAVATDVGDARVVVGPAGIVVPPGDPAALAEAMASVLARREVLSPLARAHIAGNFSMEKVIRRFADLYAEVRR